MTGRSARRRRGSGGAVRGCLVSRGAERGEHAADGNRTKVGAAGPDGDAAAKTVRHCAWTPTEKMSTADFDAVFASNVRAPFLLVAALALACQAGFAAETSREARLIRPTPRPPYLN